MANCMINFLVYRFLYIFQSNLIIIGYNYNQIISSTGPIGKMLDLYVGKMFNMELFEVTGIDSGFLGNCVIYFWQTIFYIFIKLVDFNDLCNNMVSSWQWAILARCLI